MFSVKLSEGIQASSLKKGSTVIVVHFRLWWTTHILCTWTDSHSRKKQLREELNLWISKARSIEEWALDSSDLKEEEDQEEEAREEEEDIKDEVEEEADKEEEEVVEDSHLEDREDTENYY